MSKSHHKYVEKLCPQCGEVKKMLNTNTYCSTECMGLARRADKNPNWRPPKFTGTLREYKYYHYRVAKQRGRADSCVNGCVASVYHWANLTGDYRNMMDYQMMCPTCHSAMDRTA